MLNFTGSLSLSMDLFKTTLQDDLQKVLHGEFEVVEGATVNHIAKLLDTLSGIDVWHIDRVRGIRGVALRIQTIIGTYKPYNTFTVRNKRNSGAKTEYEKRKFAIENGYLYPYITVQAYVNEHKQLLSFAVAKTVDVMDAIGKGLCAKNKTGAAQIGQAEFFVVNWQTMKSNGYKIVIIEKDKP